MRLLFASSGLSSRHEHLSATLNSSVGQRKLWQIPLNRDRISSHQSALKSEATESNCRASKMVRRTTLHSDGRVLRENWVGEVFEDEAAFVG